MQALLKKTSALEIKRSARSMVPCLQKGWRSVCGSMISGHNGKPEEPEGILIAHASIHGNTAHAAEALKASWREKACTSHHVRSDCATDLSYAVTSAFYCGKAGVGQLHL